MMLRGGNDNKVCKLIIPLIPGTHCTNKGDDYVSSRYIFLFSNEQRKGCTTQFLVLNAFWKIVKTSTDALRLP